MTSVKHSLPEMLYKNVLIFKSDSGETFSSLFYVEQFDPDGKTIIGGIYVLNIGVFGGIVAGCLSAVLYNKFKEIKLPQALSFLGGVALVSFISGITEPIEFSFVFIAPLLLVIHSLLTGIFNRNICCNNGLTYSSWFWF